MAKNLTELFCRYTPSGYRREWMSAAESLSVRADRERRMLEVIAALSSVIEKDELYSAESDICRAYELNSVRIFPKYPGELFSERYIPQIFREAGRARAEVRCFFDGCTYELSGDTLTVRVRYQQNSLEFIENSNTPAIISDIIFGEFGKRFTVKVLADDYADPEKLFGDDYYRELAELDRGFVAAAKDYDLRAAEAARGESGGAKGSEAEPQQQKLPRASTLGGSPEIENAGDGHVRIGHAVYDISAPEYKIGNAFPITPTPIALLDDGNRHSDMVVIGQVFGYTAEPTRNGDKVVVTFELYDGNTSVASRSRLEPDEATALAGAVSVGSVIAVHGYVKHDSYKGRTEEDMNLHYDAIASVKLVKRKDTAEEKRVELHLHTNMSTMDAIIPPDKVIDRALEWGMDTIAITDHANVQGFPEAMLAVEKAEAKGKGKVKVIYGLEAYFVNNMSSALYGETNCGFDDETIVFDIETTGLSAQHSEIIEIGAVRVKGGEIIETFDEFINPGFPLSKETTELTSITDEMVKDADGLAPVLRRFLDFAGNKLLIAHNANFDTGFIRVAAARCGYDFTNPYLDTLALSRFINTDMKNHKLDSLQRYYGLEDFHHHRASDDALILAKIFFCMQDKMRKYGIGSYSELNTEMSVNSDPLSLPTYHQIILVKNKTGLKNLYRLISMSYLNYYKRYPRIPKSELIKYREGLIIGSACEAGELYRAILDGLPDSDVENIASFYDYLEIQPLSNNHFLIEDGKVGSKEDLRNINRRIVALGKKYNKPVVATCDAHFLNEDDEIFRKILLAGMKFKDAGKDTKLYLRTTGEMLEEFSYLGEETAYEVVVKNTRMIADMVEEVRPIPKGTFPPHLDGADEELQERCWSCAKKLYGDPLPDLVVKRLDKELTSIIRNGFAVLYMIAQKLVHFSEEQGYLVGSRGSVGSSFVASMAGISEVNPLVPHYHCPDCHYSEFITDGSVGSGFDLEDKTCPVCGRLLEADGHDIPFETFLGFYGDKSPDIDLNFSGDVQGRVHKYTEELFGAQNVFRAGTLGTLADKTAYGFVMKYLEDRGISLSRAEADRLVAGCVGVKRTTGQHPGGIIVVPQEYDVYDFTPVQHPADDPKSNIVTTHFAFSYLHDTILKLDELGHDIPTKYKYLEKYSNTSVMDVKMNDKAIYELFHSTKPLGIAPGEIDCNIGTFGIPEFGTRFAMRMLEEAQPRTFADLLQISGLSHGTDVWTNNAQDLIKNGICDISHVIGCRDNIMNDLIAWGVENAHAFKIMESVRKGRGLTPEWEAEMREHGVPDWYIGSCKKIKYMFPKAHAAAYVMSAIRLGWYKVHIPVAFYCTMFTVAPNGFDAGIVMKGRQGVNGELKRIADLGNDASQKDKASVATLELVSECFARNIKFLPVSITESDAHEFLPENGAIRMPFSALGGLGENAALQIIKARNEEPFFSIEDLQIRAGLNKSVIETLRKNRVLEGLSETNQLSMF